ncbi:DUF2270 domain-containing protein [Pseudomonas sp. R2.Fl]|nr:DUF2270 domain-containing protein [Pseudomonas sp. R2.Fl]
MNDQPHPIEQTQPRTGVSRLPASSSERGNMLAHYYRGELARMTSWRDRIDRTSNWAITVVAGLLSLSLSSPTSHHGVVLFAMLLVSLFLLIEARRYRFFDVYRVRVRQMERHYFARALVPDGDIDPDWAASIAESLRSPAFHMGRREAVARRVRRNYIWMYLILLLAWGLKISTPKLLPDEVQADFVWSWSEFVNNATLGPLPGWSVVGAVGLFYLAIFYLALHREPNDGEFAHGEVHV